METGKCGVLLVDDTSSDGSLLVKQLKTIGFRCSFARSFEEAKARLCAEDFNIVLSKLSMNGGTAYELRPLLIGRPISLFYSLSVEQDCWWIPGVREGVECLGEPALRPDDFLQLLVVAAGCTSTGTAASAN
ncbi:MAG TPA: hypothetical protein VNJ12_09015 [Candidatus Dormibacteraeota bacterium]|nr:hypothetical protein [Candidatus Dormibacteraeota bacterium]